AAEDLRLYFTDGHLIFSKPVAGSPIAALFVADTEGGDGEAILLPPDRAERHSLLGYTGSPNLDERFDSALLLFTGDVYRRITAQFTEDSANRKAPEAAPPLVERGTPLLRTVSANYEIRMALDLLGGPARRGGLLLATLSNRQRGSFDLLYDPERYEQILAGQFAQRLGTLYFDAWTSFPARSFRKDPSLLKPFTFVNAYAIDATIGADLTLAAVTHAKVQPAVDGLAAVPFDLTPEMQVTSVAVDGKPAEVLQDDALQSNAMRGGNELIVVVPSEPLRLGREYDFEFHHAGKVIRDSGDRVLFVQARVDWYPMALTDQFATYDLTFRYPRDLDLVASGDMLEDRAEGAQRITRRRTSAPVAAAGFNLGHYVHAVAAAGPYQIDVCANRALEPALQPRSQPLVDLHAAGIAMPGVADPLAVIARSAGLDAAPDRVSQMAGELTAALQFMAAKFGPPALPRITVSPIPGEFGQGLAGLIYLSTASYLSALPGEKPGNPEADLVLRNLLQTHELAHQWWGNRVTVSGDRDIWLMEALANYSALLYLEKSRGRSAMETMLDTYKAALLRKGDNGQTEESRGPVVLGSRLRNSVEPRGWHDIIYGKGSWILHMLRARLGDRAFFDMLAEMTRRYSLRTISTDDFRRLAAEFLPAGSDDPRLEQFFEQWVDGTGIPELSMTYEVRGRAPSLTVTGTLTQTGVDSQFNTVAPVEIQIAHERAITKWVRIEEGVGKFSVPVTQAPLKVSLDPHNAVLRK
ncbi:MAG TPA: M1 family aminopeptidase, partial [Bryobacteraceae bacterium]|nr:M1 family aminopeptidase [Bryobacteraceae bacterium]